MQYYPFDSRNKLYRDRIGAVASGETLKLRLLLHFDAHCHEAFLRIKLDGDGNFNEVRMTPTGSLSDYRFYECEISRETGLYWYDFRYTSDYGDYFVIKTETSLGVVNAEEGDLWQLTVYDREFTTPSWLAGGIIYQIFPDRFYNSGKPKQNVPDDRFLCSDWRRTPQYRQDGDKDNLGNDYYGGDLAGIRKKLPYLESLGVSCIYLNPIFEAHSNHRYNTADYLKIDPLLGDENDLKELTAEAKKHGIAVILDGVFSHTGDDSVYFNRLKRYGDGGAYNDINSDCHSWYKFNRFPDDYGAWWGITTLPETQENDPSYTEFITGENGVVRKWLKAGISGWRLDVADELPDEFLCRIRQAVKAESSDAYLLGEVWEDASNKISYGARRKFLLGAQLDSVMNYPFANGIIAFIKDKDAVSFTNLVLDITENYPPCAVALLMNHIGTHDTARILTALSDKSEATGDRQWQSQQTLTANEYETAVKRLKTAAVIQFTLPGVPSVFYGDEAGVQGFGDPFCRATFPWGSENDELVSFYQSLGKFRRSCDAFRFGEFVPVYSDTDGVLAFMRKGATDTVFVAVNVGEKTASLELPKDAEKCRASFGKLPEKGTLTLFSGEYTALSFKTK